MKIKKLIIKNIASFADAEIDFTENPLSDSKLFLICGETGSGKTTILDAICLALYKDAPRLQRIDEHEDKNVNPAILSNKDARQLMRQGTVSASATLLFTGNNGIDYKAEWTVHKAYNKVDGKLRPVNWSWTDVKHSTTWSKDEEIKQQIVNAIGLSYEQFCRTCMLAQGEFSKFLFATEKDKADILEKLTNTEKYTKIGQTIFEKYSICKKEYEVAEAALKSFKLLSDDDVTEYNNQLNELSENIQKIQQQVELIDGKYNWLKKQGELTIKLNDIQKTIDELQKQKESADYQNKNLLVADWNKTVEPRLQYDSLLQQKKKLSDILLEIEKLKTNFMDLSGQTTGLLVDLENKRNTLQDYKDYVAQRLYKKDMYEQADVIGIQLSNYHTYNKSIQNDNSKLKDLQAELPNLKQKLENAIKAEADFKTKNDNYQKDIDSKNADLTAKNPQQLESDYQIAYQKLEKLKTTSSQVQNYKDEKERLNNITKELSDLQDEKQATENDNKILEQDVLTAQTNYNKAEEVYNKTKESVSDYVKELRHKLQIGDACPVCGQQIVVALDDEHFESVLEPLEKNLENCKQDLNGKISSLNQKEAEIAALERSIQSKSTEQLTLKDKVQSAWKQVEEDCLELSLDAHDENLSQSLSEKQKEQQATIDDLENKRKECVVLQEKINNLQSEKNKLQAKLNAANYDHQNADNTYNKAKDDIKNVESRIKDNQERSDEVVADLRAKNLPEGWFDEFSAHPESYMSNLKTNADSYKDKVRAIQQLESSIKEQEGNYRQIETIKSKMMEKLPEWAHLPSSLKQPSDNLPTQWIELQESVSEKNTNRNSIEQEVKNLSDKLDVFYSQSQVTSQRLQELSRFNDHDVEQIRQEINHLQKQLDEKNGAKNTAIKELEDHQTTKPKIAESDTDSSLLANKSELESEKSDKQTEVGQISQILKDNKENIARHAQQVEACEKMKQKVDAWEQLSAKIGDKEGNKFKRIIQSYVISQMLNSANSYLKKFNKRYTLQNDRLFLRVSDTFLGGAPRGVTSLSGGESFIVSLALALGLSSVGSSQVMETLFIDEGFGTLSSDYLTTVINALNTVSNVSKRQVGIISHVECLRKEIPTHIEVHKDGEYQPSTVYVVPKPTKSLI